MKAGETFVSPGADAKPRGPRPRMSSRRDTLSAPAIFFIVSAKTQRLLYVGESMRESLGYDAAGFLGGKWSLVSGIVAEEYRECFTAAIGEYIKGLRRFPLLIKVRSASGKSVDCEIGSSDVLAGRAGECVVTCRFPPGRAAAAAGGAARKENAAAHGTAAGFPPDIRLGVARELHDTVAQDLFLCKGKLIAIRGASGEAQRARFLDNALGHLDEATTSFRTVLSSFGSSSAVSPEVRQALAGEMRWARERYGLDVRLRVHAGLPALGAATRDLVLHSARELLTNVFKHSGQKAARVVVRQEGDGARIDVVDFGTGIGSEDVGPSPGGGVRLGLSGIRERAACLGGRVEVESTAGTRTRVSVILPRGGET